MTSQQVSKEEQILAAAKPLFVRYGPRKTTIDEIAQAAGLGKGTIYLYFESKEEIFAGVVKREAYALHDRVRTVVERETTLERKVHVYILERFKHFEEFVTKWGMTKEVFLEAHTSATMETLRCEFIEREVGMLSQMMTTGEAATLEIPDVRIAAFAMISSIHGLEWPWMFEGQELSIEKKAAALTNLLVNGLRGMAAAATSVKEKGKRG